jgi:hypothetical protein
VALLFAFAPGGWSTTAFDDPEAKKTTTHIDVVAGGNHKENMVFGNAPHVRLTAQATIGGQTYTANLEVESGKMTSSQAAEKLAQKLKDELPAEHKDKVSQGGTTIVVECTDEGAGPGTEQNEHQHPNVPEGDGYKLKKSKPRTTQFSVKD